MSTQTCGCDPEAKWVCERHRAEFAEHMEKLMDPREERIEKHYTQNLERPTNPLPTPVKNWGQVGTGDAPPQNFKFASVKRPLPAAAKIGIGGAPTRNFTLPTDPEERKKYPMATGLLYYFPDALAEVANVSWEGNNQHNPGQPLHWARDKSADEANTAVRHLAQAGTRDSDGRRHTAKAAWRILAMLQKEIEEDYRNGQ